MRLRLLILCALVLGVTMLPAQASASELIDRNATNVVLKVNAKGQALLSYRARGKQWNVIASGAVNALAPTTARKQVEFKLDYSGGWGTAKKSLWKTFAEHLPALHRARAALARDRVHRKRRQPLGRAGVAADAA